MKVALLILFLFDTILQSHIAPGTSSSQEDTSPPGPAPVHPKPVGVTANELAFRATSLIVVPMAFATNAAAAAARDVSAGL